MPAQDQQKNDEAFMRLALAEAAKAAGQTTPNPAVGAVIVKDGRVLACGRHRAAGQPHAEIEALRALAHPGDACGATIYVTLEPCSTHGRTPPCTDAIVGARLARAVIGAVDPNPRHAGRGLALLAAQGLAVQSGVLEQPCRELNLAFNKWIVTGRPWVIAKAALTLDGRLTLPPGAGRWLSGPAARAHAHRQRASVDAILIGAGTLRADDPRLTVRGVPGALRQPWRVVLAGEGELPAGARLFTDEHRERTLVYRKAPLADVLGLLGARQVTSVLVEGGGRVLRAFFDAGLIDEVQCYLTPHLGGGPLAASERLTVPLPLRDLRCERLGPDVFLRGLVETGTEWV